MLWIVKRSRLSLVIFLSFLCFFLACVLMVLLFNNFFIHHKGKVLVEDLGIHEYQILDFDPETNIASPGIVSLRDENIPENGYLSYIEDNGNNILISNFGDKEYQCFGTCHCIKEEKSGKRSVSGMNTVLRNGLQYLVASSSVLLAINFAKNRFQEECNEQFTSDSCPSGVVYADVDECQSILDLKMNEQVDEEEGKGWGKLADYEDIDEHPPESLRIRYFWCKGHCYARKKLRIGDDLLFRGSSPEEKEKLVEKMDVYMQDEICGNIEQQGEVVLQGGGNEDPRWTFQHSILSKTCWDMGKLGILKYFEDTYGNDATKFLEEDLLRRVETSWVPCSSDFNEGLNPSIKCRLLK